MMFVYRLYFDILLVMHGYAHLNGVVCAQTMYLFQSFERGMKGASKVVMQLGGGVLTV